MFSDFLETYFNIETSSAMDRWITIAVILLVTLLARWVIGGLLPRVIGRLVERSRARFDDRLVQALLPPVRFLVTVSGVWVAITTLDLSLRIENQITHMAGALIALGLFWGLYRSIDALIDMFWTVGRRGMLQPSVSGVLNTELARVTKQVARALVVVLGVVAVLRELGQDITGVIAGVSIAGAAVALAIKDTLANLFGYFVIAADNPFNEGEYIVVNSISGTVEHIGFRSTRIRVLDQSLVTVPNDTLINSSITNWSRLAKRRLNMTLGIEYGSSPDQVLSVVQAIRKMLETHDLVQSDSVVVQFVEFNASSLDIMIICFMSTPDWGDFQAAKQDINLKIMDILDERGVGVAFPTRTVMLTKAEQAAQTVLPPPEPEPRVGTATDPPVPTDAAN